MAGTFYTATEAARVLGISVRACREYCASGELQASKVGRSWVISEDALETFRQELLSRGIRPGPRPRVY